MMHTYPLIGSTFMTKQCSFSWRSKQKRIQVSKRPKLLSHLIESWLKGNSYTWSILFWAESTSHHKSTNQDLRACTRTRTMSGFGRFSTGLVTLTWGLTLPSSPQQHPEYSDLESVRSIHTISFNHLHPFCIMILQKIQSFMTFHDVFMFRMSLSTTARLAALRLALGYLGVFRVTCRSNWTRPVFHKLQGKGTMFYNHQASLF